MENPKKRSMAPRNTVELLIATASVVAKPQHPIARGMTKPPPPMPPIFAKPNSNGKVTIPMISEVRNGAISLCSQKPCTHTA